MLTTPFSFRDAMTRINLVPVQELSDQHLFSEFREIKMIAPALARSLKAVRYSQEKVLARIPSEFTLNSGHVMFFYDKGTYLRRRYAMLREELHRRKMRFNRKAKLDYERVFTQLGSQFMHDYVPTERALQTIRDRIRHKVSLQPDWYRYKGQPFGKLRSVMWEEWR